MYCKNLLKRHRQTKIIFYCKKYKRYIDILLSCKNCPDFIFTTNRYIKKVSNKKIIVKEEIYNKVLKRDKYICRLCGTNQNLQLHHIVYRSEDKNLINEITNCIMLCVKCHNLVHSNKHKWQPILKEKIKNEL